MLKARLTFWMPHVSRADSHFSYIHLLTRSMATLGYAGQNGWKQDIRIQTIWVFLNHNRSTSTLLMVVPKEPLTNMFVTLVESMVFQRLSSACPALLVHGSLEQKIRDGWPISFIPLCSTSRTCGR